MPSVDLCGSHVVLVLTGIQNARDTGSWWLLPESQRKTMETGQKIATRWEPLQRPPDGVMPNREPMGTLERWRNQQYAVPTMESGRQCERPTLKSNQMAFNQQNGIQSAKPWEHRCLRSLRPTTCHSVHRMLNLGANMFPARFQSYFGLIAPFSCLFIPFCVLPVDLGNPHLVFWLYRGS